MEMKEQADELLQLTYQEQMQAAEVEHLKVLRNKAQERCYEAQQKLHETSNKRRSLMARLGLCAGGDPQAAQQVLAAILNRYAEDGKASACRYQ
jgi:hypothetical protein